MGDCLLRLLLGGFSDKLHWLSWVAAQFNIQSSYIGNNLAEAKIGAFNLDYLHD